MFMKMRKSHSYSFKRHCMILQYEILALGLKEDLHKNANVEKEKLSKSEGERFDRSMYDDEKNKII